MNWMRLRRVRLEMMVMIDDNQVNSCVQFTNSFDGKRLKRILNAFAVTTLMRRGLQHI